MDSYIFTAKGILDHSEILSLKVKSKSSFLTNEVNELLSNLNEIERLQPPSNVSNLEVVIQKLQSLTTTEKASISLGTGLVTCITLFIACCCIRKRCLGHCWNWKASAAPKDEPSNQAAEPDSQSPAQPAAAAHLQ